MSTVRVTLNTFTNYFLLVKPRETLLLAFIGICSALIAADLHIPIPTLFVLICALALGSAGCNALTNYLDRKVDAMMARTKNRVLPQKLIYPAENSLYLIVPLIIIALYLAWLLNPLCFITGLIGVFASALWRKTITCTFFGVIAGCSPVLIGWFAVNPYFSLPVLMICLLVALWIPVHVWSVLLAKKNEYLMAGLHYFPINLSDRKLQISIFILTCLLFALSICFYPLHIFGIVYLILALIMGGLMLFSAGNLIFRKSSALAWRVYKMSSFPYLGVIFISMLLDKLL